MNELEAIRALGRTIPEADDAATARARLKLLQVIDAEQFGGSGPPENQRRPYHRLPWVLAAVAASIVVLFALGLILPMREGGSPPAAADSLSHLAKVAASQPPLTPRPSTSPPASGPRCSTCSPG